MTPSSVGRRCLVGRLSVARPREEAFDLFTPSGERSWAEGWDPSFPEPDADDTAPGTVFVTQAHGHETTWVVVERIPSRRIRYARVVHGVNAGTVTVDLEDAGDGTTAATVTYELTPLSEAGRHQLAAFAAGYEAELAGWGEAIAAIQPDGGLAVTSAGLGSIRRAARA